MPTGPGNIPEGARPQPVPPLKRPIPAKPEFRPAPRPEFKPQRDEVEISPAAREIQTLRARLAEIPDPRPARVEEIRARLGQNVNNAALNAKIAEKLLTGE